MADDTKQTRICIAPKVVWITGLAGAGKTAIADALYFQLKHWQANLVRVDGDAMRDICGNDLGFSPEDRLKNAYRLSRFCKFLSEQGLFVLCSTMSLYPEIWDWNRKNIDSYVEIYLRVSMQELEKRDKKGLYSKSNSEEYDEVIGRGQVFHEPADFHLVVENERLEDFDKNVARILNFLGVEPPSRPR